MKRTFSLFLVTTRLSTGRVARLALVLCFCLIVGPVAMAELAPVVVAVDTSRSLNGQALGETIDRLRLTLEALDAETPTALLAFDDQPQWVVALGATPREVSEGLQQLTLKGNYTLLNDALFVATRELDNGGVLLLATDGRDENSAVEVDDIARRCEAQGVRIVSIGTGGSVEERALRRLALLSNGAYLGPVAEVDASVVADGVKRAQQAVARRSSPAQPARVPARPAPSPGQPEGQEPAAETASETRPGPAAPAGSDDSSETPWWQTPAVWGLGALVLLMLGFLAFRRRSTGDEADPALEAVEAQASDEAEAGLIRLELAQAEIAREEEAPEVTVDTAVFQTHDLRRAPGSYPGAVQP